MSQFQEVKEVKGEEEASCSSSAGGDVNGKGDEKAPGYWFYSIGDFGFVCNELRETASAMDAFARANGAPKFILGLGDNFYLHQDWRLPKGVVDPRFKNNWRDVFVCKKHLAQVPWYLILGNHDYESDYQCQIDYTFNKKENSDQIWNMPAQFYSRNFANLGLNLDLFAIDTNCVQDYVAGEHGCAPEIKDLLIPQKQWLRDEFAKVEQQNSDSWRIVIGHHCMYTQSKGHAATAVKLRDDYQMEAALEEAGVDLYICGHEHVFQHHKPESGRVQHIVCGNSGADKRDGIGLYRGMGDTMKLDWFDRSNTVSTCITKICMHICMHISMI
jgi:tartrate-resistant acid phosphatase type 5